MINKEWLCLGGALLIGFMGGYSFADANGQIKLLKLQNEALEIERDALAEEVQKEYEWQEAAAKEAQAAKTELSNVEAKYNSAVSELNTLYTPGMHPDGTGGGASALPADTSAPCRAAGNKANAGAKANTERFERLSNELMLIAKDCEINDVYLKQCIKLYNSVRQ